MLIVFTTFPDSFAAEKMANLLVESRLAACVQILPEMRSVYVWDGKVQYETEHLLLIKTLPEKWEQLRDFITSNHSYDVPEIVAVDAEKLSEQYSRWLSNALVRKVNLGG